MQGDNDWQVWNGASTVWWGQGAFNVAMTDEGEMCCNGKKGVGMLLQWQVRMRSIAMAKRGWGCNGARCSGGRGGGHSMLQWQMRVETLQWQKEGGDVVAMTGEDEEYVARDKRCCKTGCNKCGIYTGAMQWDIASNSGKTLYHGWCNTHQQ